MTTSTGDLDPVTKDLLVRTEKLEKEVQTLRELMDLAATEIQTLRRRP